MAVLGLSLLLMFAISVAALVTPQEAEENILRLTWRSITIEDKSTIQQTLNCCGFNNQTQDNHDNSSGDYHPPCNVLPLTNPDMCCSSNNSHLYAGRDVHCPNCPPCLESWVNAIHYAVRLSGGFGLVFSFTQIIGIILTIRYRNEKDPTINFNAAFQLS
jgi:tetraspanin-13/31